MKTLNFGIEIEMVISRETAARTIAQVLHGRAEYSGGTYGSWTVTTPDRRTWKVVRDSSIDAAGQEAQQAEMVSPILTYADLPLLQETVRALRHAGAKTNDSCGIHIHVDASRFDGEALARLAKSVAKNEHLLFQAIDARQSRISRYTQPIADAFIARLHRHLTKDQLKTAWYTSLGSSPSDSSVQYHYNPTRYHGLNLHSVWYRGTIEFRYFNSTLHAGKVQAYVHFCLALAAHALNSRGASARKASTENPRFTFRILLRKLGLDGAEFKNTRLHLLANLQGNSAWRYRTA